MDTTGEGARSGTDTGRNARRPVAYTDGGKQRRGVVVLNAVSGSADHAPTVRSLAADNDFAVRETESEGDAIGFAREAAETDAKLVVAAGGDGTVNEVVRGLVEADALGEVALGVVPCGTGNNFAGNIGVESIAHAFEVLASGDRRRLDIGVANGRPFVNSCVAGLTADASAETDDDAKSRLGVLAYAVTTLRTVAGYDGSPLAVETNETDQTHWEGEALLVLIGNARRFSGVGGQAHTEDGLQEVLIIEEAPPSELLGDATFGSSDGESITRLSTPEVTIRSMEDGLRFSLDGEIVTTDALTVETRRRVLDCFVGPEYEPVPGQ